MKQVNAVAPQDVLRVAREYIRDGNFTNVVVGDRKTIEQQLKPYGPIQ